MHNIFVNYNQLHQDEVKYFSIIIKEFEEFASHYRRDSYSINGLIFNFFCTIIMFVQQ